MAYNEIFLEKHAESEAQKSFFVSPVRFSLYEIYPMWMLFEKN